MNAAALAYSGQASGVRYSSQVIEMAEALAGFLRGEQDSEARS